MRHYALRDTRPCMGTSVALATQGAPDIEGMAGARCCSAPPACRWRPHKAEARDPGVRYGFLCPHTHGPVLQRARGALAEGLALA